MSPRIRTLPRTRRRPLERLARLRVHRRNAAHGPEPALGGRAPEGPGRLSVGLHRAPARSAKQRSRERAGRAALCFLRQRRAGLPPAAGHRFLPGRRPGQPAKPGERLRPALRRGNVRLRRRADLRRGDERHRHPPGPRPFRARLGVHDERLRGSSGSNSRLRVFEPMGMDAAAFPSLSAPPSGIAEHQVVQGKGLAGLAEAAPEDTPLRGTGLPLSTPSCRRATSTGPASSTSPGTWP